MAHKSAFDARRRNMIIGLVLLLFLLLLHQAILRNFSLVTRHPWETEDSTQDIKTTDSVKDTTVIPNIVHFVHLVRAENPVIEFSFQQFIAVYSAWHYLQPEALYIHTNIEEALIKKTLSNSANAYTQAISKLPGVRINHHSAPNQTESGMEISWLPNQSDFVRTEVLERLGGIYLDDDAYILRDLKPFYRLGFENIVGIQSDGQICPAVVMSTPHNNMMIAYRALQDSAFDGTWAHHATYLLSALVRAFQFPAYQVLVLSQATFFPLSWDVDALKDIYQVHEGDGDLSPAINDKLTQNVTDFIKNFSFDHTASWRRDWRLSYVLHGWNTGLQTNFHDESYTQLFGQSEGITLDYVLTGNSNFARAVLPAVKHAVDSGVLAKNSSMPEQKSP